MHVSDLVKVAGLTAEGVAPWLIGTFLEMRSHLHR